MPLNYNAPIDGTSSSIDGDNSEQMASFFWLRKSLIEARKDMHFTPLSTTRLMPKFHGKTMKTYHYLPLLDDRNINDQGIDAAGATIANGNLYGSSKDIGTIGARLPVLGENGGRVNRVGFTRLTISGSLHKFGFFTEFSNDSLQFDSDPELMAHLSRELLNGAIQITEAILQRELLASAGVVVYPGVATQTSEITGESINGAPISLLTYEDLSRLDITLTDNRCPRSTTIITGSRLQDTKTLPSARVAYIGSELTPVIKRMRDSFDAKAFIPVHQYADAGTTISGEIGAVDNFRFVQVPEMLHWAGAGAAVNEDASGYRTNTVNGVEHFNVYPLLVVGEESFSCIGYQTDGKSSKFTVRTKMPNKDITTDDPFAEIGLSSIRWFHGFLCLRPERIAVIKTIAPV